MEQLRCLPDHPSYYHATIPSYTIREYSINFDTLLCATRKQILLAVGLMPSNACCNSIDLAQIQRMRCKLEDSDELWMFNLQSLVWALCLQKREIYWFDFWMIQRKSRTYLFWLIHFVKIPSHSTQSGSRPSKNIIYGINKNCNHNKYFQVKVWFQNRRTKHKREETETDQQKALSGSGLESGQTILEHDESDEEDIDCE